MGLVGWNDLGSGPFVSTGDVLTRVFSVNRAAWVMVLRLFWLVALVVRHSVCSGSVVRAACTSVLMRSVPFMVRIRCVSVVRAAVSWVSACSSAVAILAARLNCRQLSQAEPTDSTGAGGGALGWFWRHWQVRCWHGYLRLRLRLVFFGGGVLSGLVVGLLCDPLGGVASAVSLLCGCSSLVSVVVLASRSGGCPVWFGVFSVCGSSSRVGANASSTGACGVVRRRLWCLVCCVRCARFRLCFR